jgi:hypothetical protein
MAKKNIYIATPIHTSSLSLNYVTSLFKLINNNPELNINVQFRHSSLVNRGRNELLNLFMNSNYDYIFFIDSDIVNFEDQFLSIIKSFFVLELQIPLLMLGAIYPIKHYNFHYKLNNTQEKWQEALLDYNVNIPLLGVNNDAILKEAEQNGGFVSTGQLAGGFMMFSKNTLKEMFNFYPDRKYNRFYNDVNTPNNYLYNLFDSYVEKFSGFDHYLSEDYGFCELFKQMGGKIYSNIKLPLSHAGEEVFTGSLYNTLMLKKNYNTPPKDLDLDPKIKLVISP